MSKASIQWAIRAVCIVVFCTLVVFIISVAIDQNQQIKQKYVQLQQVQDSVQKAQDETAILQESYRDLNSPENVEKYVRDKLGWVREGEVLYIFEK